MAEKMQNEKESNLTLQIRVADDVASKFKTLAEQLEVTQGAALEQILAAYEDVAWKVTIPDRQKEVDELEGLMRRIIGIYKNAVDLNKHTEDNIRQEFSKKYQEQEKMLKRLAQQIDKAEEAHEDQKARAISAEKSLKTMQSEIRSKNDLILSLRDKAEYLERETARLAAVEEDNKDLRERLKTADDKDDIISSLQQELAELKMTHKEEILELKTAHQEKIQEIRDKNAEMLLSKIEQIEKLQAK